MRSGLNILHEIDAAIVKARRDMSRAAKLPERSAQAMAELERQQTAAFEKIATLRLEVLKSGGGGELGYVDRQAQKLLIEHNKELQWLSERVEKSMLFLEQLEAKRRKQEKVVTKAIDNYDKSAAAAEAKLITQSNYMAQLDRVDQAETTLLRLQEKLKMATEDERTKSAPYKADPLFSYLLNRQFGTPNSKGWVLTRALDRWVADVIGYDQAIDNYYRLGAIPVRLEEHLELLNANALADKHTLEKIEADFLKDQGVTGLREKSLEAQKNLDAIDQDIESAERAHQKLIDEQIQLTSGQGGSYQQATELLAQTLLKLDEGRLRYLASQTVSREDDQAVKTLRELRLQKRDIEDEQSEAQRIMQKIQNTLKELERIRRRYKQNRYDAPSSVFSGEGLLDAMLGQVLAGVLSSDDFWRSMVKAQRTIRRYSDNDFGGIDWTEGLRLPRNTRSRGGSYPRRTSIPRQPRQRLPKVSTGRGSRGSKGGFRTGGGF